MEETELGISHIVHVLKDFLSLIYSHAVCDNKLEWFITPCDDTEVPLAPEKTFKPSTVMIFLRYELDTSWVKVQLPVDKLTTCNDLIQSDLPRPLWDLQYTVGTLRFACTVVHPGRAFLRWLIDLTIGTKKQYHFIRVTRPVRDDLCLWAAFLTEFNSESLPLPERWQQAQIIHLFTDASSSLGYGAVLGKQWFSGVWDNEWQGQNIKLLEQYPSPWLSRSGAWPWHTNVLISTQALRPWLALSRS